MCVNVYGRGGVSTGPLTSLDKWGEMFRGAFALRTGCSWLWPELWGKPDSRGGKPSPSPKPPLSLLLPSLFSPSQTPRGSRAQAALAGKQLGGWYLKLGSGHLGTGRGLASQPIVGPSPDTECWAGPEETPKWFAEGLSRYLEIYLESCQDQKQQSLRPEGTARAVFFSLGHQGLPRPQFLHVPYQHTVPCPGSCQDC